MKSILYLTISVLAVVLTACEPLAAAAQNGSDQLDGAPPEDDRLLGAHEDEAAVAVDVVDPSLPSSSEQARRQLFFFDVLIDLLQAVLTPPSPPPTPSPVSPPTTAIETDPLPSTADFAPLRINCGGGSYTDSQGQQWEADRFHNGVGSNGFDILNTIFQTPDAGLFQSFRYNYRLLEGALAYDIPVPDGAYQVVLYFAEVFFIVPEMRVFNVWIEDSLEYSSVDVAAMEGGERKVVALSTTVPVDDGEINIRFQAVNRDPFISAIEVLGIGPTTTPAPPTAAPISQASSTDGPSPAPVSQASSTDGPSPALSTSSPSVSPTDASAHSPVNYPTKPPTDSPTRSPIEETDRPTNGAITITPPTKQPTDSPTRSPVEAPVPPPVLPNTVSPPVDSGDFETILINSGGEGYTDFLGRDWMADTYFVGGTKWSDGRFDIERTQDDEIFHSERNGIFSYEIPVPAGNYEVVIHMAELYWENEGSRKFNIAVEGNEVFTNVDIIQLGGGSPLQALTLETPQLITDGYLSISFYDSTPKVDNPKVSGIEVKLVEDHLAHAVANGPYSGVDVLGIGSATVPVDGSFSHTHGQGLVLVDFIWKTGSTVLTRGADKKETELTLPVGENTVSLTVIDSGGNESTEVTTISVLSSDFPAVESISPDEGVVAGGLKVTINGSGFTYSAAQTKVKFGLIELTGSNINIVDSNKIEVSSPGVAFGAPVAVSVETPKGESNSVSFTYIASTPIEFESGLMFRIQRASCVAWGPDRRLYVGTENGYLHKISFVDGGFKVSNWATTAATQYRSILGIAFDPLDVWDEHPKVYFSNSFFFHGDWQSTSGKAINGKISVATGANLDEVEDIITGLPVSGMY